MKMWRAWNNNQEKYLKMQENQAYGTETLSEFNLWRNQCEKVQQIQAYSSLSELLSKNSQISRQTGEPNTEGETIRERLSVHFPRSVT